MSRYIAPTVAVLLIGGLAFAQVVPQPGPPTPIACAYNTAPPTLTTGQAGWVQCDASGAVITSNSSGGVAQQVVGNVASGATDSGNPVKIGGRYNTSIPTLTDGQRGDLQVDTRANLRVTLAPGNSTATIASYGTNADALASVASTINLATIGQNFNYNGTNWDRQTICTSTAVVNVTAAATTEIVPLTAAQTIRVCSFAISMSAAGTAQFLYGTGSNCAGSPANITGAIPLATGTPLAMGTGTNSIFRTASANALCVAAVTGNVVGFVTYAKY